MDRPFILPTTRRVWPWTDDGCGAADGLLNMSRLPSLPYYGAVASDGVAEDAVAVLVPVAGDGPEYVEGTVQESDPDNLDG